MLSSLLLLTLCIISALAQTPIPTRPEGHVFFGHADANITVDFFGSLTCPDTAAAWPVLMRVTKHFTNMQLRVRWHNFPLPYHEQDFLLAQGSMALPKDQVFHYIDYCLDNLDQYSTYATANMSRNAIVDMLTTMARQRVSLPSTFSRDLSISSPFNTKLRTSWKYAASRGVTGTPWFLINGVNAGIRSDVTELQWLNILKELL